MLDDAGFRALAQRYARLVSDLELEPEEPLLVLPNAEFFPDRFTGDARSVERLIARMQGYAALESVEIETRLVGEPAVGPKGGCGTGACGAPGCAPADADAGGGPRLERLADRYLVRVPAEELAHSIVLTARLATALGAIALLERHPRGAMVAADPAQAELAATALGFGVLLLEASYLYSKSCGGPNVKRATTLATDELAPLFSLFLAREGHAPKAALEELATTQRAMVKEAWEVVGESPGLVRLLRDDPERVARGDFSLRDGGSVFSRFFGRRKAPKAASASEREALALKALERGASVEELEDLLGPAASSAVTARARKDADPELRALVDEALGERHASERA